MNTTKTVVPRCDNERVHGDPRLPAHFWSKTTPDSAMGCWNWTAKVNADGYGCWAWKAGPHTTTLAHRIAYLSLVGPIQVGLVIDHLCRNRRCVNPAHLEPVTQRVNLMRGNGPASHRVTHCINGHQRSGDNLYVSVDGRRRSCRACNRAAQSRFLARKVAANA